MKVRGRETKVHNGVKITPNVLESWAEDLVKNFESDPNSPIHYIMSGNSLVILTKDPSDEMEIFFTQIVETVNIPEKNLNISSGGNGRFSPRSNNASSNIYCSCGGPTNMVFIAGEMVMVCKICKKEVEER